MKACKDCLWFCADLTGPFGPFCKSPDVAPVEADFEHGRLRRRPTSIRVARDVEGPCGEEAKYWEPRPPTWWQRLLGRSRG